MGKKISTAGLCSPATPGESYQSKSIRKIENGFVVSESRQQDGEYSSREYFVKTPNGRGVSVGGEALTGAIKECNK